MVKCCRAQNCLLMSSASYTANIASRTVKDRVGEVSTKLSLLWIFPPAHYLHQFYCRYKQELHEAIVTGFLYAAVEIHDCLRYESYVQCRTYWPHITSGPIRILVLSQRCIWYSLFLRDVETFHWMFCVRYFVKPWWPFKVLTVHQQLTVDNSTLEDETTRLSKPRASLTDVGP
jgi:hypothetical protein